MRISDDVGGIHPELVEEGKQGHFGLRGMRERAERIRGTLTLVTSPRSGTVVTRTLLAVPSWYWTRSVETSSSVAVAGVISMVTGVVAITRI